MMLTAVLFDLGGTLLHYHDPQTTDHQRHFRRITQQGFTDLLAALRDRGYDLPTDATLLDRLDEKIRENYLVGVKALRGGSIETPMRAALAVQGFEMPDRLWHEVRDAFYRRIDEIVSPRIGLIETLTKLQARYKLGIVSNTYWAGWLHDRHLEMYDLLDFFPVRVYSSDSAYRKPHPSIFKQALAALDTDPKQAAYVGDRLDVDVSGAQAVGMKGVLIRSPYRSEEIDGPPPDDVTPDAVIDELPDLPAALHAWED
jgi:HAD superfamily hydrolase (TIGR01509 family)